MQCFFCHAWNDDDAPRCVRCGRRVPSPAGKSSFPFLTATALALDPNASASPADHAIHDRAAASHPSASHPSASHPAAKFMSAAAGQASGSHGAGERLTDRMTDRQATNIQSDTHAKVRAAMGTTASGMRATATAKAMMPDFEATAATAPAAPPANDAGMQQPWLLRSSDILRPKVVPIPILTPRVDPMPRKARTVPRNPAANRKTTGVVRQEDLQRMLDLHETADALPTVLEAVIDCDAPVAPTQQRMAAAMVDSSLVATAVVLFLAIFHIAGGELGADRQSVLLVLVASMVLALLYRVLWCIGGGDTPGTRSAGLRVVNFDGRIPDRVQRGRRLAAGVLSVLSVGLGLIWVLVDEEHLAWHDHISKTFPTPI